MVGKRVEERRTQKAAKDQLHLPQEAGTLYKSCTLQPLGTVTGLQAPRLRVGEKVWPVRSSALQLRQLFPSKKREK